MHATRLLEHVLLSPSGLTFCQITEEARLMIDQFPDFTFSHLEWPSWAWPGGYPIYYVCADDGILCSKCANENIELTASDDSDKQWRIVDGDINYEDDQLWCDHCNSQIESAYGDTPEYDDSMDGDHDSGMASAGHGTDEDYGGCHELD